MSQRERIIAQLLLHQSGSKVGWNDLSPELQEQYLDDARAYIKRQDAAEQENGK